jgi:hypothetical protein
MKYITFIGNCQMLSLCFYFQQLLQSNEYCCCWILYGKEFKPFLGLWSYKCNNKIIHYHKSIEQIKRSDVIIYQEVNKTKSLFCNEETLNTIKKTTCTLIKLPSIYLDYTKYNDSIKELYKREIHNNVDIKISYILHKFRVHKLMLTIHHPTTFLFMIIVKRLCTFLHIPLFTKKTLILSENV